MYLHVYRAVMEQIQSTFTTVKSLRHHGQDELKWRASSPGPTAIESGKRTGLIASVPYPAQHRVEMRFIKPNGWEVCFFDVESSQPLGRMLRFQDSTKLRETAQRGKAFAFPRKWLAMNRMLQRGAGAMILTFTDEQFLALSRSLRDND